VYIRNGIVEMAADYFWESNFNFQRSSMYIEAIDKHTYACLRLTLGLLVFSINVDIKYNRIKMLPQ